MSVLGASDEITSKAAEGRSATLNIHFEKVELLAPRLKLEIVTSNRKEPNEYY